jgi:DNA-binding NtrC family response regulator
LRILIIDDNETFCRELEDLVQLRHHIVAWCTSGRHGLERALEEPFDLVIADGRMLDETGLALSQRLHESLPEMPVLVLNTVADKSITLFALRSSVGNLAATPLHPQQLLELIQRASARFVRAAE